MLANAAEAIGLDGSEIRDRLDAGTDADAVKAEIEEAGRIGVTGVPFYILAGSTRSAERSRRKSSPARSGRWRRGSDRIRVGRRLNAAAFRLSQGPTSTLLDWVSE